MKIMMALQNHGLITFYQVVHSLHSSPVVHLLHSCISSIVKLDLARNLSDHHALSSNLDLPTSVKHLACPYSPVQSSPGIAWHKVTEFNLTCFRNLISSSLPSLPPDLISCSNLSCMLHQSLLDQLCSSLLACISQAAIQSLPLVKCRSSAIPEWNEAARSLKSKASFWHKAWLEAGSPSAGILHQIKLASKCRYKYEVRRLKCQSN